MQLLRECMRELGEEFDSYQNCMNLKAAMTKFKNGVAAAGMLALSCRAGRAASGAILGLFEFRAALSDERSVMDVSVDGSCDVGRAAGRRRLRSSRTAPPMNKYEVQGVVGEGAYGVVIRCRHRESGEVRAIKKFRESEDDEAVRKTAVREVKILKMLRHASIVRLHEAFRRKGRLYLVFEYMPRNLLEVLEEHPRGLSLQVARVYLHQLVHAIDWCHQHAVVHRDIKPENLLVDPARGTMKLCDFGFSRMLPADGRAAELTDYVATRWYSSPELLL